MATILTLTQVSPKVVITEITIDGDYQINLDNTKKYLFSISKLMGVNMNWVAKLSNSGVDEDIILNSSKTEGILIAYKDKVMIKVENIITGSKINIEGKILN